MNRQPLNIIQLDDDKKKKIKEEIAAFYMDVFNEEIGIIKQQQLLDLFVENLAPVIYNKALDDAKAWYSQQQSNLDSDYYMLYRE